MRIFDNNNVELLEYDKTKGILKEDQMFVKHHDGIEAVEEQGHYNTIREYPNGGKDVEWVVDVPGVKARDAWDEYEDILRFIPFTEAELATNRISELKQMLRDTDYVTIKIAEGVATKEEYADILEQRSAWRTEINNLELVKED